MLDIQNQIKEETDRQAVMILLQSIDSELAVLKMESDAMQGELWIAKGKYVCHGKVQPSGEGGLSDILRLLSIKEGRFDIEMKDEMPPRCPLQITLAELIADENAVIEKIKNKLWPVVELEGNGAEESVAITVHDKAGDSADVKEESVETNEESAESKEQQNDSKPEAAESEGDKDAEPQTELSESKEEPTESKVEPDDSEDVPTGSQEDLTDSNDLSDPKASIEATADLVGGLEAKPANESKPADEQPSDHQVDNDETPEPGQLLALESTDLLNESPSALASLFDEDEDDAQAAGDEPSTPPPLPLDEPPPLPAAEDEASTPPPLPTADPVQPPPLPPPLPDGSAADAPLPPPLPSADPTPPPLPAYSAPDTERPPLGPNDTHSLLLSAEMIAAAGLLLQQEPDNEEDIDLRRKREHFAALKEKLGEDASHFYDTDDQVAVDDLDARRQADLQALNQLLTKRAEEFEQRRLDEDREKDDLTVRRKEEYEALKNFYGETGDKFYEEVPKEKDFQAEAGLNDLQSRILDILKDESADPKAFQETDPKLREGGDIRPSWELPAGPIEPEPEPPPVPAEETYKPNVVESPYADVAPDLAHNEVLKHKLPVDGEAASFDLINRRPDDDQRQLAIADETGYRRPPTPDKLIVAGIAAAIAIPIGSLVIWHYFDARAQEEMAEQRAAALLAERSIEKKSVVAKPQEPFRMPAGSTGPSPGPPNGGSNGDSISPSERNQNFSYNAPAQPHVMTDSEVAAANIEMQKADAAMTGAAYERAATIYINAVRSYPTYTILRVKAARALIAARKYREAYDICMTGLDLCPTRSDFDMLVGVIREIP
jgi:hypothetical protein